MLFELRKLTIIEALSEETACYTAQIWIDGALAFEASNRGQGGADHYRQAGTRTEAEVDAWLKANRTAQRHRGVELEPSLEFEVARLIDEVENSRLLRKQLRTRLVTIEGGNVFSYPLGSRSVAALAQAVLAKNPQAEVVNLGGQAMLRKAVKILQDRSAQDEAGPN